MTNLREYKRICNKGARLENRQKTLSVYGTLWSFLGGASIGSSAFAYKYGGLVASTAFLLVGGACIACAGKSWKEYQKTNDELARLETQVVDILVAEKLKSKDDDEIEL